MLLRLQLGTILIVLVLLIIGLWIILQPGRSYACSCIEPGSPTEALERSAAVFAGRVVSMEVSRVLKSGTDPVAVEFNVKTIWKGPADRTIRLTTPVFEASCGYSFNIGVEYLVYSRNGSEVSLCSRTKPLWEARDDVAELGQGQTLAPSTTPHTPGGPGGQTGGGCGPSAGGDGLLAAGMLVGLAWLGFGKRRAAKRP